MLVYSDLRLGLVLFLYEYNNSGCCVYGCINTGNCIVRFLSLSMPNVTNCMS